MARIATVAAAGIAHHVTQWGNRRIAVVFSDDDREEGLALLAESGNRR